MKIKQRLDDFRVRELLAEGFLQPSGEHRVYRVTKRKLTSLDAARELAEAAGVAPSDVGMAGLKDRQGVTTQYMSIRRGREVALQDRDLAVESVGFAEEGLESRHSLGNAFELTLRGLEQRDLDALRDNLPLVREAGVVNYFDEQRFGNLRHNQGWIAELLMRGEVEEALRRLLASLSERDDAATHGFKRGLLEAWGDWTRCRELAGRFGEYHSIFEHLKKEPTDFAGAFFHVGSRLRLIHLYALQSHVWNRAVADTVRALVPEGERVVLPGIEGPLVFPSRPLALAPGATFRLPGPGLEDVTDAAQRGRLEDALSRERLVADQFRIEGVPGFQLKGEDRELIVVPRHLRVRPPEGDRENYGAFAVRVRFELARGAYATLVVRRLLSSRERAAELASPRSSRAPDAESRGRRGEGAEGGTREREGRGADFSSHSESGESLAPPRPERRDREWRGAGGGRFHREQRPGARPFGEGGARERDYRGAGPFQGGPRHFERGGGGRGYDNRGDGERGARGGGYGGGRPYGDRGHGDQGFGPRPGEFRERRERDFGDRPPFDRARQDRPYGRRPYSDRGHGDRPFRGRDQQGGDRDQGSWRREGADRGYRPHGDRPYGDRPFGDRPQGGRPFGERNFGGRPYGDRPFGDRPYGGRPQGDRPWARRPYGERSQGQPFFRPDDRGAGSRGDFRGRDQGPGDRPFDARGEHRGGGSDRPWRPGGHGGYGGGHGGGYGRDDRRGGRGRFGRPGGFGGHRGHGGPGGHGGHGGPGGPGGPGPREDRGEPDTGREGGADTGRDGGHGDPT